MNARRPRMRPRSSLTPIATMPPPSDRMAPIGFRRRRPGRGVAAMRSRSTVPSEMSAVSARFRSMVSGLASVIDCPSADWLRTRPAPPVPPSRRRQRLGRAEERDRRQEDVGEDRLRPEVPTSEAWRQERLPELLGVWWAAGTDRYPSRARPDDLGCGPNVEQLRLCRLVLAGRPRQAFGHKAAGGCRLADDVGDGRKWIEIEQCLGRSGGPLIRGACLEDDPRAGRSKYQ